METGRLDTLLRQNDLNERGFAYYKHCLSETGPVDAAFMENFQQAAGRLFDECRETLGWQPAYIVSHVLKRRDNIQRALDRVYMTQGCRSAEARMAEEHYRMLSRAYKEGG